MSISLILISSVYCVHTSQHVVHQIPFCNYLSRQRHHVSIKKSNSIAGSFFVYIFLSILARLFVETCDENYVQSTATFDEWTRKRVGYPCGSNSKSRGKTTRFNIDRSETIKSVQWSTRFVSGFARSCRTAGSRISRRCTLRIVTRRTGHYASYTQRCWS